MDNPIGRITNLDNLVLSGNRKGIRMGISQLDQLNSQLTFSSNDNSTIELTTSESTIVDADLLNLEVPYLLTTSLRMDSGNLRIRPGVTLNMGDGVGVDISGNASFSVVGTAEEPINLTHEAQLPGAWSGITVASNSNLNRIEHASVSFAGGSFDGIAAAVKLECNPLAMLFIANTKIEDSAGWGVLSSGTNGCALELGENVQFNRNRSGDIGMQ